MYRNKTFVANKIMGILIECFICFVIVFHIYGCSNRDESISTNILNEMEDLSEFIYEQNRIEDNSLTNKENDLKSNAILNEASNKPSPSILNNKKQKLVEDNELWNNIYLDQGRAVDCVVSQKYNKSIDNELRVSMGDYGDLYLKILELNTNNVIREVFIKQNSVYKIINIPEGKYYLKTAFGKGLQLNQDCEVKFDKNAYYKKSENVLDFYIVDTYYESSVPSFHLSLDVKVSFSTGSQYDSESISMETFNN